MTSTDLIDEILLSGKYHWAFVFKNPVLNRPCGQTLFVCEYNKFQGIPIRTTVVSNEEGLFLIAQINIMKRDDDHLVTYENLIEYQQRSKRDIRYPVLDLDNPFYNIEWLVPIAHKYWVEILGELNQIQVPLRPPTKLYRGDTARTILIKEYSNSDYIHYHWSTDHEGFNKAEELIDKILYKALGNIQTAYYKPPVIELSK